MNKKQRKATQKYSSLYSELTEIMQARLEAMPVGCFTECIPDDHTGTKKQWKNFAAVYCGGDSGCLPVYKLIRSMGVLADTHAQACERLTVADWVNLRDVLTLMMTKYWIGVPSDWGEIPSAVEQRYQEAIKRNQN